MVSIENIRHSLAHLMAAAVKKLYPKVKFGIGPTIENGFYYDFDFPQPISENDLARIKEEMKKIAKENHSIKKELWPAEKARNYFKENGQIYKVELIDDLVKEVPVSKKKSMKVGMVYTGNLFLDLCRGGHVKNTKELPLDAFALTRVAGAYWKGSENRPMLTRIYGLAFQTKEELEKYLKILEQSQKRDHRKIGQLLELFSFHEEAPGLVFWHPKGMILRENLMKLHDQLHKEADYQTVSTPLLLSEELWKDSGHWDNYKDKMYFTKIDGKIFAIKPMNCPGEILIYKNRPRSYKELPLRFAELGEVHRHEPSGTLHGLFRVRAFRQDDAHIFCQESQIEEEIKNIIKLTLKFYKIFKFTDVGIELSTRPEKSIGTEKMWRKAEGTLKKVLKDLKLKFRINEGEGAFYGPKIDFHIKDSIARSWQCGTIQLDFSMPERFNLEYIDNKGRKKRPVMIHRTVIGSIQRFVGILLEHFSGALPLWLSPEQIWVIPVGSRHEKYAKTVAEDFAEFNLRVKVKNENKTVSKKIREGEIQKIPYLLVVGDEEVKKKEVRVRERGKGDIGLMKINKFLDKIKK